MEFKDMEEVYNLLHEEYPFKNGNKKLEISDANIILYRNNYCIMSSYSKVVDNIKSIENNICKLLENKSCRNVTDRDLSGFDKEVYIKHHKFYCINILDYQKHYSDYLLLNNCNVIIYGNEFMTSATISNIICNNCFICITSAYTEAYIRRSIFYNCDITTGQLSELKYIYFNLSVFVDCKIENLSGSRKLKFYNDNNVVGISFSNENYGFCINHKFRSLIYNCSIGENSSYELNFIEFIDNNDSYIAETDSYNNATINKTDICTTNLFGLYTRYCDLKKLIENNLITFKGYKVDHLACPESGSFTGYKIVLDSDILNDLGNHENDLTNADAINSMILKHAVVMELDIPDSAKRSSAFNSKCRCSEAKATGFYKIQMFPEQTIYKDTDSNKSFITYFELIKLLNRFYSRENISDINSYTTIYKVGETISVDNFEDCRYIECAKGIHFFMTKEEAVDYLFLAMI